MRPITLITGSRKGIGRYLAEHFLAQGHQVIGCSRKVSDFSHEHYVHFCLDVGDPAATSEFFNVLWQRFRGIDNLINNAGVAGLNHSLLMPSEQAQKIIQTNFSGTYFCSLEAARLMMKQKKGGRIVNFSSTLVPMGMAGHAVYAASKAAVECLTRIQAKEFGSYGITVNAVGPADTDTDLVNNISAKNFAAVRARQAIPRETELKDIINAVDFFLRPESSFVTGQIIYLGGV